MRKKEFEQLFPAFLGEKWNFVPFAFLIKREHQIFIKVLLSET